MSNESSNELIVKPAPHINAPMSKNRMMQYTFVALLIITAVSAIMWWPVTCPTDTQVSLLNLSGAWQLPLGAILIINALIAIGVAVGTDLLLSKTATDAQLNFWSAAVFGLIVTLSYSLGVPGMAYGDSATLPVSIFVAPGAFVFVALISFVGLVLFKKMMGLASRKLVNPAAASRFLVLLPFMAGVFLTSEHSTALGVPSLAGPIGGGSAAISGNGAASFITYLTACYANPSVSSGDVFNLMFLSKFHGWPGGASSLAVIIVGIALFAIAHKYFKWKVTLSYLVSISVLSVLMSFIYADGDLTTRLLFEVFMGSSIFMAFFMATDPATTPFTGIGQIIFGVGLAILTIVIQTYMGFFGGSLLALIIMNLTVPLIDRIRIGKPFGR
jgi:electron transport complex protein RnfD